MTSRPLANDFVFTWHAFSWHAYSHRGSALRGCRCYSTALYAFEQNSWFHVEDHLNFALGRQTKQLADYPTSMQYLVTIAIKV